VVRVRYLVPNFLAKRFILEMLEVDNPVINLVRHSSGRWNYEEVLRLSEGPPGQKSTPPLIEFRNMKLRDGALSLAYPWPTGNLTPARRDSQVSAVRAIRGRMVEDTPEGTKRIMAFSNLTTAIRRLRISTPDRLPLLAVIDTLRADASEPQLQIRQLQGTIEQKGDSLKFWLTRASLPGTQATAEGMVSWPRDTIMWDFHASASRVDLVDLRFISPDFPAMRGRANIVAQSPSGRRANYALTLGAGTNPLRLKVGALTRSTSRDADTRSFGISARALSDQQRALTPDQLFDGSLTDGAADVLSVRSLAQGGSYSASDALSAGYAMADLPIGSHLSLITGARVERSDVLMIGSF